MPASKSSTPTASSRGTPGKPRRTGKPSAVWPKMAAKNLSSGGGMVVVVGTAFRVSGAEHYHIALGPGELKTAWRRTLAREARKFVEEAEGVARAVRDAPARTLPDYLMSRYGIGGLDIMTTLEAYGRMEKAARAAAERERAVIASPSEIFARILRLRPAVEVELRCAERLAGRPSPEVAELARRAAATKGLFHGWVPGVLRRRAPGIYISAWHHRALYGVCILSPDARKIEALGGTAGVRGVGSRLVAEAARLAKQRGAPSLELDATPETVGFYLRRGFRLVGGARCAGELQPMRLQLAR